MPCAVFVSILHLVFWSCPSSQSLLSLSCKENKLWKPYSAAYCIVIIYEWQIHCVALLKKMCCWNAHLLLWLHCIHWVCLSLLADWDCCEQECQQTDCQDTVVTLARNLSLRWWILPVNGGKLQKTFGILRVSVAPLLTVETFHSNVKPLTAQKSGSHSHIVSSCRAAPNLQKKKLFLLSFRCSEVSTRGTLTSRLPDSIRVSTYQSIPC